MIKLKTGNIFESNSDALVNTVNCEGFMGKGIAYQFKIRYPKNNDRYKESCKNGDFKIGSILVTQEEDKTIINFPTKDKWRKKSEYEFIEKGMERLVAMIPDLNIKSIAIPPLGCGNGGLDWEIVKSILIDYLNDYKEKYEITLYEPSKVINKSKVKKAPKLNSSHIILMLLKKDLSKFNKIRLQKSSFLLNYYAKENYFKFNAYNYGPYANSINILSRDIKEFQLFYQFKTEEALNWAMNTNISNSVQSKIKKYEDSLIRAISFVNKIKSDKELELLTTLLFIIENNYPIFNNELPTKLREWSNYKAEAFTQNDIEKAVQTLLNEGILSITIDGLEPTLKKEISPKTN
jgi:O-acetyl-ADP-ribose deacetylase (regulator of RNase III)